MCGDSKEKGQKGLWISQVREFGNIKQFQPPQPATAVKRYFISTPPLILTLHLKRFEQVGTRSGMKKFNGHVHFDMLLDLAPFCSDKVKVCKCTKPNNKNKKNTNRSSLNK
jgi:hypothetical protein